MDRCREAERLKSNFATSFEAAFVITDGSAMLRYSVTAGQ